MRFCLSIRTLGLLLGCLVFSQLYADEGCENRYYVSDYYCNNAVPPSRSDEIPQTHVAWASDEYLTGYLQALVDMNYFEFQVKVIAKDGIVYVFNLPCNPLLSQSILCFLYDVPCVKAVEAINCPPEQYFRACLDDICWGDSPCCQIKGIWFPQLTVLFQPLIADPRQVTNSAAIRFNDDVVGKHVGAVSFGDDFSFFRWLDVCGWGGDLEFLIEAGIFSVFNLDHAEESMVNTDFFVAATFAYAINCWSFRLRLWHLSSHLGDEFLLAHPGFPRCNLSDEGIDLFASYQCCKALRLYVGIGDIFDRDKSFPEKPFYVEGGAEIRVFGCRSCFDKLYVQPFFAMHFRSWAEHNYMIDQTYVLGLEYSKIQGIGRKLRLFGEYHNGYSREGQFLRHRCSYSALRMTYGF